MIRSLTLCLLLSLCLMTPAVAAIHIAPNGDDAADGSQANPVATIARAAAIADEQGGEQTIELAAGTYNEWFELAPRENAPRLTITAAQGAKVVFDYGYGVDNAEAVEGSPGVYRVPIPAGYNSYRGRRAAWETDTRTRYRRVADPQAVAAYPASYRFESVSFQNPTGWLYFHTSDGQPPSSHDVGFSFGDGGPFRITRDNVTVRGLHFQNVGDRVFVVVGADTVIEDCTAWNVERMVVYVSADCPSATLRNLVATDIGSGIYSEGVHTVVEGCRFTRASDNFESHAVTQEDSAGIQLYSPAVSGKIHRNLVVGFRTGIFCKKGKGAVEIAYNTVYGGGEVGISFVHWYENCIVRNNIVAGAFNAYDLATFDHDTREAVFRDNVLWNISRRENLWEAMTVPQASGSGQGVLIADPQFAAPALGDFRLQPGSPALRAGDQRIGAFGAVDDKWQDAEPPTVSLSLEAPASRLGVTVEHFWERDHWNEGGGVREPRPSTFENAAGNQWLVPSEKINIKLTAADNASPITQMKLRTNDGGWSKPMPFAWSQQIDLPADSVDSTVQIAVADAAGNWSEAKSLRMFRVDAAPQVQGDVNVYKTRNGVVLTFNTDTPCTPHLVWGTGDDLDRVTHRAPEVYRDYDAEFGAEIIEHRSGPRQDHVLALQTPDVEPGATLRYRIVLDSGVGHTARTDEATVALTGDSRTLTIDPAGENIEGDGNTWRTLQFAVDRALPGDRIVLRDGLYTNMTTIRRGGIEGAPLTIEAENKGRAVLDMGKRFRRAIQINDAPYITVRGLEVRWITEGGLNITDSAHVTLEDMYFWNEHLIQGRRQGNAFYARRSPYLAVRGCLLVGLNEGFAILDSHTFTFEHNTIIRSVHRGCRLIFATRGSTMVNNLWAFNSNESIQAHESPSDWETFDCDYNLYASFIRASASVRPEGDEFIPHPGVWGKTAKGINQFNLREGRGWSKTMQANRIGDWREISGKDAHSTWGDPEFVDPYNYDYRLKPDSPAIGAGKDGATIGALGVAEQMQ